MNKNVDWFNLFTSYFIFAFIYSAIIWISWNYLFAPVFNLNFSYLQILGAYTIARLLFGNTNTNYVSNFYSSKVPDLNKIDEYLKNFQEELDKESKEVEDQYRDLDKKD
ncbi:MAG: hypothetical protein EBR82_78210 [Caulobacteraceae bacterium]|nr:hypothetical protein [Caulobacteraceae bacterium]